MTNDELAIIFAKYLGNEVIVITESSWMIGRPPFYSFEPNERRELTVESFSDITERAGNFKILLHRIENISNEHCEIIGEMFNVTAELGRQMVYDVFVRELSICGSRTMMKMIDKLRELGYDCDYLISREIALDKSTME